MKNLIQAFTLLIITSFIFACGPSSYKVEDLHGSWVNEKWDYTFNADGSCSIKAAQTGDTTFGSDCTYRTVGNALEIACGGTVIFPNLTVKGISGDSLHLEFRDLGTSRPTSLVRKK